MLSACCVLFCSSLFFFWTSTRSAHNYQLDAFQFFAAASAQHVFGHGQVDGWLAAWMVGRLAGWLGRDSFITKPWSVACST